MLNLNKDNINEQFIRNLLKMFLMNQKQFGKFFGLDPKTINRWINGGKLNAVAENFIALASLCRPLIMNPKRNKIIQWHRIHEKPIEEIQNVLICVPSIEGIEFKMVLVKNNEIVTKGYKGVSLDWYTVNNICPDTIKNLSQI